MDTSHLTAAPAHLLPAKPLAQRAPPRASHGAWMAATGFLGVVLAAVSLALAFRTGDAQPGVAVLNALSVGMPVAVGLYAWWRQSNERFGLLLVAVGLAYFLVTLAVSRDEVIYSLGRIAAFAVGPLVIYVFLTFPTGRLESRASRVVAAGAALTVAVLAWPTIPLTREFPPYFPWGDCTTDCPANAFFSGSEPGIMTVLAPAREAIFFVFLLLGVAVLAGRLRAASALQRRTLVPVLVVAAVWLAALAVLFVGRRTGNAALTGAASWVLLAAIPLTAVGVLVGMLQWRSYAGVAIPRLIGRLAAHPAPPDLRRVMSDTLNDPSLRIAYWAPAAGGYVSADGVPIEVVPDREGRGVTPVAVDDRPVAAIIHDRVLNDHPELLEAVAAAALLVLDRHRLDADLNASIRQLRESQGRILAAADRERERIERNLHDGAQQRLVALRMKLALVREIAGTDPGRAAVLQGELGRDVDEALDEIRDLARGVYPPLLASGGLPDALAAVASSAPVPTTVRCSTRGRRFSREIESAVYFCCREALQNAGKHGGVARRVTIVVRPQGDGLAFDVTDDGDGFDVERTGAGTGLTNMSDRLGALGGTLTVDSRAGVGTAISGRIPLR